MGNIKIPLRATASTWQAMWWQTLATLVLGAMLVRWAWVLFAPSSASVLPASQPADATQTEHLFGIAVSNVPVQVALPNVRLVGVFAPGFAILELDGNRQKGLATGTEIVPGAKLVEVAIDHVIIERNGARQEIPLEGRASASKRAADAIVHAL